MTSAYRPTAPVALGLWAFTASAACAPIYDCQRLRDHVHPPWALALDINDQGETTGLVAFQDLLQSQAVLWRADGRAVAVTGAGQNNAGRSISNSGEVVGHYTRPDRLTVGYRWKDGDFSELPSLTSDLGGVAVANNDAGQVVGYSTHIVGGQVRHRATLWVDGHPTALGELPGHLHSHAVHINQAGDVVGSSVADGAEAPTRAVLWRGGEIVALDDQQAPNGSTAVAINDRGVIVGMTNVMAAPYRIVAWVDGELRPMRMLDRYTNGLPTGIDNQGQVVGYLISEISESEQVAVLWPTIHSKPINLNKLVPGGCVDKVGRWKLEMASAINAKGEIAAVGRRGTTGTNKQAAFKLTPVPASVAASTADHNSDHWPPAGLR